jgi:hypothetical protein
MGLTGRMGDGYGTDGTVTLFVKNSKLDILKLRDGYGTVMGRRGRGGRLRGRTGRSISFLNIIMGQLN